jgi:hypothetical protein
MDRVENAQAAQLMMLANPMWLTAGVVVGGLHAAWLWHAAHRASYMMAAIGTVRLLCIALILVGAALAGGLVPACMGWGVGFLVSTAVALRRSKAP